MGLEMQLVDQIEVRKQFRSEFYFWSFSPQKDAIKDFERNMSDMVGTFVEAIQGYMSQCRDMENTHHERLMEMAIVAVEKMSKNEFDEDIPDDLRDVS